MGQSTLTPSISGETPIFLRGTTPLDLKKNSSIHKSGTQLKYHWQSEDFGLDNETATVA